MYLFLDIETSDLIATVESNGCKSKIYPYIVSIAWIIADSRNAVVEEKFFIIYPSNYTISKDAEKLHNISYEKAKKEGVKIDNILAELNSAIDQCEIVVCHNCMFDLEVINKEFQRNSIESRIDTIDSFCTMKGSGDYYDIYNRKYPKLDELYLKVFSTKLLNTHNSQSDANATMKIFFELLRQEIFKPDLAIKSFLQNRNNNCGVDLVPYRKGKKWGFCNKQKDIVIDAQYNGAKCFSKFLFGVGKLTKLPNYIIKFNGDSYTKPMKTNIISSINFSAGCAILKVNNRYGIINENGNVVHRFNLEYESISEFSFGFAVVKKDITNLGEFNYSHISKMPAGMALEVFGEEWHRHENRKVYKYGYIDINGNEVIALMFDDAKRFSGFVAPVCLNRKWFFINKFGQKINDIYFDDIYNLGSNCFLCKENGLYGLYDKEAKMLLNPEYSTITNYTIDYIFLLYRDNHMGFYNMELGILITPTYKSLKTDKNCMIVQVNDKYGFLDFSGNLIKDCIYDEVFPFNEGLAIVRLNGLWFIITENFRTETRLPVDGDFTLFIEDLDIHFSEGLIRIQVNDKYGFLDFSGNLIKDCIYDEVFPFNEGLAIVRLNGLWFIITENFRTETRLPVDGDFTLFIEDLDIHFSEGLIRIVNNGKFGFANECGVIIIPCIYDYAFNFSEGLACVELNRRYGFIDKSGQIIIDIQYRSFVYDLTCTRQEIPEWKNDLMSVYVPSNSKGEYSHLADFTGFIDKKGLEYWEDDKGTPDHHTTNILSNRPPSNDFLSDSLFDDLPF